MIKNRWILIISRLTNISLNKCQSNLLSGNISHYVMDYTEKRKWIRKLHEINENIK